MLATALSKAEQMAKVYEETMKLFGELRLVRALTDEQIEAMRHPQRPWRVWAERAKVPTGPLGTVGMPAEGEPKPGRATRPCS